MLTFITIICLTLLSSCIGDNYPKLINIKNNFGEDVVIFYSADSTLDDNQLVYGPKYSIPKDSLLSLHGAPFLAFKKPSIFFLNKDSVYNSIKNKQEADIVKKAFLCKYKVEKKSSK